MNINLILYDLESGIFHKENHPGTGGLTEPMSSGGYSILSVAMRRYRE